MRKHSLNSFWRDVLESEEFLDLTNEINFVIKNSDVKSRSANSDKSVNIEDTTSETIVDNTTNLKTDTLININCESSTIDNNVSDCEIIEDSEDKFEFHNYKLWYKTSDSELFNLGRTLGTQDYIGQRILQVATILRNLSFIEENIEVLSKNESFVRFLLLCSNARWNSLHNMGLDMLGNVASEYVMKDTQSDKISCYLVKLITKGLQSEDRTFCIASLDALNKLSQTESNEDVLSRSLDLAVYQRVCSFLTLHDVMLLVYTLECLYSLSSLGEKPCNLIVGIHGVVDTLVSLVTVEGKSYGPKACIGMKLVETVPGGTISNAPPAAVVIANSTTGTATGTTSTTSLSSVSLTSCTTPSVITSIGSIVSTSPIPSITPIKTIVSAAPARSVQVAPQRVIIAPASSVTSKLISFNNINLINNSIDFVASSTTNTTQVTQLITPQQLVQQQHAHQQAIQENEHFALAWLRATYEPCSKSRIDHQELYKHYINCCAKIGRRGVIAPLHFPRCVR